MQAEDSRVGKRARGLGLWPWALAALAVGAQSAAHLTNALALDGRYPSLDATVDSSVFGRANSLAIGLSAALAVLAARRGRRRAPRLVLAACLVLVMVDDATGLHDRLGSAPRADQALLALAIACALALTAWLLGQEAVLAARAPRLLLVVGVSVLVAAVLVRLIGAASGVGASLHETPKALGIACEQGLDFGGWILVALGLFAIVAGEDRGSSADAARVSRLNAGPSLPSERP